MKKVLNIKKGRLNPNDIERYIELNKELDIWKRRLQFIQGDGLQYFWSNTGYDRIAIHIFEKNQSILGHAIVKADEDEKLEQELIDFLECKVIDNVNRVVRQINKLLE